MLNHKNAKKQTYVIHIPPVTDVQMLMGNYGSLLGAWGIAHTIPYLGNGQMTHPIPESQQTLLDEFMHMNQTLSNLNLYYDQIQLTDLIISASGKNATFVFSMVEKPPYVEISQQPEL